MDWDHLRIVLAIGRHGSLTGAGEVLGVSHTTVGRRLGRLEEQLGVRLFDRTPEGFVPTDAGAELVELAGAMETQVLEAERRLGGHDTRLVGPLRVSTLDRLFEAHAHVFASFRARYPDIALTVTATEAEVSLFRREADVAFRMTNTPPETVIGRRVGFVDFAVYGHRDLVHDPDSYEGLPWLHWDEHLVDIVRWMDAWLAEVAPDAEVAMRLGENTLMRRAALHQGIGVHPMPCAYGDAQPDLVRVGPVLTAFRRQLWLLMLPSLRDNRRVRAFVDHVAEALRPRDHAGSDT